MEIKVKDVSLEYDHAFKLFVKDFAVNKGELVSIMGSNGAGKTTFLMLLSLQLKPESGKIFYNGIAPDNPQSVLELRRKMSSVFQRDYLFSGTVLDNVAYPLKIRRYDASLIKEKAGHFLELFGIDHLADKRISELSSGQSKRVCLARALVYSPEMIFLDEPMSMIDFGTKASLLSDLKRVIKEINATAIFVTQERSEAFFMCDRLVFINNGRIVEDGTPQDICMRPGSIEAARFFGSDNLFSGRVIGADRDVLEVTVEGKPIYCVGDARPDEEVFLMLGPENVVLATRIEDASQSARNIFACEISSIDDLGPFLQVELFCGFRLRANITRISAEMLDLRPGSRITASFKASAVHVIKRR